MPAAPTASAETTGSAASAETGAAPAADSSFSRLQLIGLGAAVKLQSGSGSTAFQMSNQARRFPSS